MGLGIILVDSETKRVFSWKTLVLFGGAKKGSVSTVGSASVVLLLVANHGCQLGNHSFEYETTRKEDKTQV